MATQPLHLLSPEEYVALEQKLGVKHEYHAGQVFAMAGASEPHARIQMNLAYRLTGALMDSPCSAYPSDLRVVIEAADMATTRTSPSSAERWKARRRLSILA